MRVLAPGTTLVPRSAVRHSVTTADKSTRVVRRTRTGTPDGSDDGGAARPGASGAVLLTDAMAGRDERRRQPAAAEYRCAQHVAAMLELYGV
ncbi:hypothetical protein ACFW2D_08485 [Streptomyces sp. NPDC058914]|uniref:hypothetical protein n=1 Tax=Streptomyces sp. NPDC058914 TaxID=3346671 RepID=UPI003687373B